MKTPQELLYRIQDYLVSGGLFNPEMMEHEKVRNLIMDCRELLTAMNDLRYQLMRERLNTLADSQLQEIIDKIDIILFDEYNYHEGKFCPMGIALGCHLNFWGKPTNEWVRSQIGEYYKPANMLKGVPGEFYHGNDAERKRDLLALCREIIKSRASELNSTADPRPASPRLSDPSESCLRSEPSGPSVEQKAKPEAQHCSIEAPQAQKQF